MDSSAEVEGFSTSVSDDELEYSFHSASACESTLQSTSSRAASVVTTSSPLQVPLVQPTPTEPSWSTGTTDLSSGSTTSAKLKTMSSSSNHFHSLPLEPQHPRSN